MDLIQVLVSGIATGLAVAIPLGAIGILLLQEGASLGRSAGLPAAMAVAAVDTLYCGTALATGSLLTRLVVAWGIWPRAIGAVLLMGIAVRGLVRGRTETSPDTTTGQSDRAAGWQRFSLFFGLTIINPTTIVYFAAVVAARPASLHTWGTATLFLIGVSAASLGWQYVLVSIGAVLGRGFRSGSQRASKVFGYCTVLGYCAVGLFGLSIIAPLVM